MKILEKEKLDPEKVLERSQKILQEKSKEYWAEFFCMEKTLHPIKDRTNPRFFKIPGKYLSLKEAEEIYHKKYENTIETSCKEKFPVYVFIKILTDNEKNERIKN